MKFQGFLTNGFPIINQIEGCNTNVLHDINKVGDCNNTLNSLYKDNLNKFIFARLNINSIRNKFELFS